MSYISRFVGSFLLVASVSVSAQAAPLPEDSVEGVDSVAIASVPYPEFPQTPPKTTPGILPGSILLLGGLAGLHIHGRHGVNGSSSR